MTPDIAATRTIQYGGRKKGIAVVSPDANGATLSIFMLSSTRPRTEAVSFHGEIVVRAYSADDARAVASDALPLQAHRLNDEDLFHAREVNYGEAFRDGGPRGVLLMTPSPPFVAIS